VNITRRRLLVGGLASVFAGAAGTAYWQFHDGDEDEASDLLHAARELLGDAEGAPWLAAAYLRAHPGITTKQQVARRMRAGTHEDPSTASELRQVIRSDFAAGRMVMLDGWYFAESEAAAAALVALNS
jgi:ABC-type glycerol-3-phosphate transport system substrate-binding protein